MQDLSIGAVSKLTQIPAHTLRKWESRHGIATPTRTPTGRRVYTQDQVEQLKLIKHLVASGHALPHLKDLSLDALQDLNGLHETNESRMTATSLVLVGPNVARRLTSQPGVRHRVSNTLEAWLDTSPKLNTEDSVIVEATTIPTILIPKLLAVKSQIADLLVVYNFTSSRTLHELSAADIQVMQGYPNDADLLSRLEFEPEAPNIARPTHRFNIEELARIAALSPGLQCECPNHIAQILMDISSFERYSAECADTDPESKALHDELGSISARARALFEDALVAVAAADGLALDLQS